MELLKTIALFLAKGKLIMWVYTINMILLSWYATVMEKTIDGSVAIMYTAALGAWAGKKGFDKYQEAKQQSVTKQTEKGDI
jgi:hypothetical protein